MSACGSQLFCNFVCNPTCMIIVLSMEFIVCDSIIIVLSIEFIVFDSIIIGD